MAIVRDGKHLLITDGADIWMNMAFINYERALLHHRSKKDTQKIFDLLFDANEYLMRYLSKDDVLKNRAIALAQFKKDIKW
jgi:hypothetical protein